MEIFDAYEAAVDNLATVARVVEGELAAYRRVDAVCADDEVRGCAGGISKLEADFVADVL